MRIITGPSPRAWGSHRARNLPRHDHRSIPTCVGLSPQNGGGAGRGRVHPHVRGALEVRRGIDAVTEGPSPRAWGSQLLTCSFVGCYLRVICLVGVLPSAGTLIQFCGIASLKLLGTLCSAC